VEADNVAGSARLGAKQDEEVWREGKVNGWNKKVEELDGKYSWISHNAGFDFLDLAPPILHSNWF
jgi:hypothetical protein